MSGTRCRFVTVPQRDSYKSHDQSLKPSTHDSAGAQRGAKNTRRPMPSPVDSSADVHPIVQGAT
jgi:hypothetical protein